MKIETLKFGRVEVAEDRCIRFPNGILGFPRQKEYALFKVDDAAIFLWLQSTEVPGLAFVVTDPAVFFAVYKPSAREETLSVLGANDFSKLVPLVIVNKHGDKLTANLQGPLLINPETMTGVQLVLPESHYHTQHVIGRVAA